MKNKYLIIAMNMSNYAAGIVFKKLLKSMKKFSDFDIICPEMDDEAKALAFSYPVPIYKPLPYKLEFFLLNRFGYKISEKIWVNRVLFSLSNKLNNTRYDAVISFVYGGNMASISLGKMISDHSHLPWVIYSVDAIPMPEVFTNNLILRGKQLQYLKKYIPFSVGLFLSNPLMLKYELNLFPGYRGLSGTVFTPSDKVININRTSRNHNGIVFLYAGAIQRYRNVKTLIDGFVNFSKLVPDSRLVFVGSSDRTPFIGYESLINKGMLIIHEFTNDLASFYNEADVLVDLNADVKDECFLSSKVCNYLAYDKIIISISQDCSPVRAIFDGVKSIIHSHHNSDEICMAMEQASKILKEPIKDRDELRVMFDADYIAEHFCNELRKISSL